MRWMLIAAALLLLTGCYESSKLLIDPAAARQPITTAKDWTYGSGDHRVHARLSPRSDGWYDYGEARLDAKGVEGKWKSYRVVLNSFDRAGGYDVFVYGTYNGEDHAYMYGLVVVGSGGFWQTVTPNCDPITGDAPQRDRAAATRAGAKIASLSEVLDVCQFTSRDQLYAALHAVIAEPGFWQRVKKTQT
jgi:hypothetical protein